MGGIGNIFMICFSLFFYFKLKSKKKKKKKKISNATTTHLVMEREGVGVQGLIKAY